MTVEHCTATVNVVGIGTFTCENPDDHGGYHEAGMPSDKWAVIVWSGDTATIRPPGTRRAL